LPCRRVEVGYEKLCTVSIPKLFSLILVAVDHLATEFVSQLNPNPETPFNQNYPFTNLLRSINCGQNVTVKVWE
jgi:hypothetical protein